MVEHKTTTLITGASSGIGLELARLFAKDGHNLILVARSRSRLESLAAELQASHPIETYVIEQDLSVPSAARAIARELEQQSLDVDILVNNAGTQVYGEFTGANLDQLLALMQVNITTVVGLTHLLLPGMIRRKKGRILNLGSTGSFAPGPLNAVYCASKAFVLSFSEALAAELSGTGVTVTTLCPGATDTEFPLRAGIQDIRLFRKTMRPDVVAKIGYRALMRGRPVAVAGVSNRFSVFTYQLSGPFLGLMPPSWLMAIGNNIMGRSEPDHHQP